MRVDWRRETREHAIHLLVVPAERNRQVRQLRGEQALVHFRGLRLQARRLGLDGDGVANGADLERDVDARGAVDRDGDLGLLERLESLLAGFEAVDAGRQVAEIEMAGLVGECLTRLIRVLVGHHDGGARHGRARACPSRRRRSIRRAPAPDPDRVRPSSIQAANMRDGVHVRTLGDMKPPAV